MRRKEVAELLRIAGAARPPTETDRPDRMPASKACLRRPDAGKALSARAAPGGEGGIAGGAAPKTRSMRSSRIIRLRTASRAVSRRFLFLAAWAVLPSCLSPERAFVADTDPGGWAVSEPAVVRFDNSDTVSARTIDLIVRYGRDFRYDRLSVAVTTVSPSGRQRRW